ncbi:MAG: hypothetical protein WD030_05155 [Pirellulales bacterium]
MLQKDEYCAGWMDSSIHDFLSNIDPAPASMKFALLTCLDSSTDVASLLRSSEALQPLESQAKKVGESVLVSTRRLLSAQRKQRIFFGFDEIWFLPTENVTGKPTTFSLVGPEKLHTEPPDKAIRWMDDNGCSLGLGDGTGLNFVAKLHGVARYLVHEWTSSVNYNATA